MILRSEIIELFNNKDFSEKLLSLENDAQVKEHFKSYGVEISDSELEDIRKLIFDMVVRVSKLSASDLEKISGGSAILLVSILPSLVGLGVGCLGIPKVIEGVNETKLQKKNLECETQKNIALINAKEISSIQMHKSAEKIVGYAMIGAVLSTGIVCFKEDIRKWWNDKSNKKISIGR